MVCRDSCCALCRDSCFALCRDSCCVCVVSWQLLCVVSWQLLCVVSLPFVFMQFYCLLVRTGQRRSLSGWAGVWTSWPSTRAPRQTSTVISVSLTLRVMITCFQTRRTRHVLGYTDRHLKLIVLMTSVDVCILHVCPSVCPVVCQEYRIAFYRSVTRACRPFHDSARPSHPEPSSHHLVRNIPSSCDGPAPWTGGARHLRWGTLPMDKRHLQAIMHASELFHQFPRISMDLMNSIE